MLVIDLGPAKATVEAETEGAVQLLIEAAELDGFVSSVVVIPAQLRHPLRVPADNVKGA